MRDWELLIAVIVSANINNVLIPTRSDLVIFVKVINGVSSDIFIILEFLDIDFLFQGVLGQIKLFHKGILKSVMKWIWRDILIFYVNPVGKRHSKYYFYNRLNNSLIINTGSESLEHDM
jgi:hypothetical protein